MEGKPPEIRDPRVTFITGIFQESLPVFLHTFVPKNRLVIKCDADLGGPDVSKAYLIALCGTLLQRMQLSHVNNAGNR